MIDDIRFDPSAKKELEAAKQWFDDQQAGLGLEFALAFEQVVQQATQNPFRFPSHALGTRRCLILRFKYAIVFVVQGNFLVVVAVHHSSRRPRYWRRRIT